jgi:hypothetical protein
VAAALEAVVAEAGKPGRSRGGSAAAAGKELVSENCELRNLELLTSHPFWKTSNFLHLFVHSETLFFTNITAPLDLPLIHEVKSPVP